MSTIGLLAAATGFLYEGPPARDLRFRDDTLQGYLAHKKLGPPANQHAPFSQLLDLDNFGSISSPVPGFGQDLGQQRVWWWGGALSLSLSLSRSLSLPVSLSRSASLPVVTLSGSARGGGAERGRRAAPPRRRSA